MGTGHWISKFSLLITCLMSSVHVWPLEADLQTLHKGPGKVHCTEMPSLFHHHLHGRQWENTCQAIEYPETAQY